ncbi:Histone H3 [Camponotus japonicus]
MNPFEEDEQETLVPVMTCGVCEIICDTDNITKHECLEGYAEYYVDENTCYFYPMCEDGSLLSLVDNEELTVQESSSLITTNKRKNIRKKLNIDEKQKLLELEEHLILEVHTREPLWNPQIELSLRSRKATAQLWKEVSEALNEKLSATEAKAKFKSLHDTYRRIISTESLARIRKTC